MNWMWLTAGVAVLGLLIWATIQHWGARHSTEMLDQRGDTKI